MILNASEYTKAIDIWSIGCIFAELLGRTALFPGEDYLDQIQRVISVLGTPSYEDLSYIANEHALMFVKGLPKRYASLTRSKQGWASLYPNSNSVALDLLSKMLTFNPNKRYTVEQCLAHPYFEGRRGSTRPAQQRRRAAMQGAVRLELRQLRAHERAPPRAGVPRSKEVPPDQIIYSANKIIRITN